MIACFCKSGEIYRWYIKPASRQKETVSTLEKMILVMRRLASVSYELWVTALSCRHSEILESDAMRKKGSN